MPGQEGDQKKMKIKYRTPFTMIENKTIRSTKLTIYQKMAYIVLCSYANDKNICFPSYQTIADDIGCSRRKIISIIKELVEMGIIVKHQRKASNGDPTANEYEILLYDEYCAPPSAPDAPPGSASPSPPDEQPAPEQYIDNNINFLNNNHPSSDEADELEEILFQSEIDGLHKEKDRNLFHQVITNMYYAKEIMVCGIKYPQTVVRENMRRLDYEVIVHAFDTLHSMDVPPAAPQKFLTSVIFNELFIAGTEE